jgi:hypothetical protein
MHTVLTSYLCLGPGNALFASGCPTKTMLVHHYLTRYLFVLLSRILQILKNLHKREIIFLFYRVYPVFLCKGRKWAYDVTLVLSVCEIRYECYAIGGHTNALSFHFLQLLMTVWRMGEIDA